MLTMVVSLMRDDLHVGPNELRTHVAKPCEGIIPKPMKTRYHDGVIRAWRKPCFSPSKKFWSIATRIS